ncbi:MAG: CHASE2 domain-containing protein [Tepidisphaerales bacterium]
MGGTWSKPALGRLSSHVAGGWGALAGPLRRAAVLAADVLAQIRGKQILDARRRRAAQLVLTGLTLTLLSLLADTLGLLRGVENFFYDTRVYLFQYNLRRPSESLVHLDIDEGAITTMGRWPWSRRFQARVVDEIARAGPRVVFLDIIYAEPSRRTREDGEEVLDPASDEAFAEAVGRAGNVLVPLTVGLKGEGEFGEMYRRIVTALVRRDADGTSPLLTLRPADVAERIGALDGGVPSDSFSQAFLAARERAVELRVLEVLQADPQASLEDVRTALLGSRRNIISVIDEVIALQYRLITQRRTAMRFTYPIPAGLPELLRPNQIQAPLTVVGEKAAYSGYVDYVESSDGDSKVRFVPLLVNLNGRMLPHVSLSMFCAFRGVSVGDLRFEPGRVVVPATAGFPETVIPVRTLRRGDRGDAPLVTDIPWFGGRRWETMYDVPEHRQRKQRVSMTAIQNIFDTESRIQLNIDELSSLLTRTLRGVDAELAASFASRRYGPADLPDFRQAVAEQLALVSGFAEGLAGVPEGELDEDAKTLRANFEGLLRRAPQYLRQFDELASQLEGLRADLRRLLGGKVVLVGMTGTGTMDFYPTAIHSVAPGVVAHGALVNGLLVGELWTRAPEWVTRLITAVVGVTATLIVAFASPLRSSLSIAGLFAAYTLLNGFVLFDRHDLILGVAGPVTALGLTWAGVTLVRFVLEIVERNRITARFRSYVDPELVNYIAEHPDQASFAGRKQVMTVVFTDLEGFTTLSERLGEGIVATLNDYVATMTPIIRGNRGFIDKFLGDGIMFEFNAVIPNPTHAIDAVNAVLQMQKAMGPFNEGLLRRGLPTLRMRVGINTGPMIFGDAGGAGANNITVLGDAVNLAARLEGANKPFGTLILMTQDTLDHCDGRFAVRPIANVRVKGKEKAVVVYEPLGLATELTDDQRQLIRLTTDVFQRYSQADFHGCIEACERMNAALGGSVKFAQTYHHACRELLGRGGVPADFDGSLSLTEK